MFRTPDIPTGKDKEFDDKVYEEEKLWLKRKQEGKIASSRTDGTWILAIGTSALVAFVIGGVIGTVFAFFTENLSYVVFSMAFVFGISLYLTKSDFAKVEVDVERGQLLYEGNISLGGELRSTRYRGPYKIIETTLLVRFRKFKFLKSKPYIRFMTNSGYMRVNFKPEEETEFLQALQKLGLVNIESMKASLDKKPVRKEDTYIVYFEKRFNRKDFYAELKRKRELEEKQKQIDTKMKRKQLLEKTKKYRSDKQNDGNDDS